jgi:hypothetical protein
MGIKDLAFTLQQRLGSFIRLGNGVGDEGCKVHNPTRVSDRKQSASREECILIETPPVSSGQEILAKRRARDPLERSAQT